MKPLRPRYPRIVSEVLDTLKGVHISAPPIPVDKLAQFCGAKIMYEDFDESVSGVFIRNRDSVVIGVSDCLSIARKRFVIAHQLGHLLLHTRELYVETRFKAYQRTEQISEVGNLEEVEANIFALSLLVPYDLLKVDIRGISFDIEDAREITKLAKRYAVSAQAMTFRLMSVLSVDLKG